MQKLLIYSVDFEFSSEFNCCCVIKAVVNSECSCADYFRLNNAVFFTLHVFFSIVPASSQYVTLSIPEAILLHLKILLVLLMCLSSYLASFYLSLLCTAFAYFSFVSFSSTLSVN